MSGYRTLAVAAGQRSIALCIPEGETVYNVLVVMGVITVLIVQIRFDYALLVFDGNVAMIAC